MTPVSDYFRSLRLQEINQAHPFTVPDPRDETHHHAAPAPSKARRSNPYHRVEPPDPGYLRFLTTGLLRRMLVVATREERKQQQKLARYVLSVCQPDWHGWADREQILALIDELDRRRHFIARLTAVLESRGELVPAVPPTN